MARAGRLRRRTSGWRALVLVAAALLLRAEQAGASCNLIPSAVAEYPSTLGTVDRTIAHPGGPLSRPQPAPPALVTVRRNLACEPLAPGFDPDPEQNRVILRFERTGDEVEVPRELKVPAPGCPGRCDAPPCPTRCDAVRFGIPDTDADGDGIGLAGPTTIFVRAPNGSLLAQIGPLYEPTDSCDDRDPEDVFRHFTLLPRLNDYGAVVDGATTQVVATLDGGDSLLIGFDYRTVLARNPGDPIFRLLAGSANLPAGLPPDPSAPIQVPVSEFPFVRSFSINGRPLPPILEATAGGQDLFGTVDAAEGVVRIARQDDASPPVPIYDLRSRLVSGNLLIRAGESRENLVLQKREVAPLEGLSASKQLVAFARDENVELEDLNGDSDLADLVPQLVDVATAGSTSTGLAVTQVASGEFTTAALRATGDLAAFVGEPPGPPELPRPTHLRVFDSSGSERTPGSMLSADPGLRIDGRSVAISPVSIGGGATQGRVVFRQPAAFPGRFERAETTIDIEIAPDGRHVYIWRDSDHIDLYERDAGTGSLSFVTGLPLPVAGLDASSENGVITPDGSDVLTLLAIPDRLVVQRRDPSNGMLSPGQIVERPGLGGHFASNDWLVVSPDGRHVYVNSRSGDSCNEPLEIAIFERDPLSGLLEFHEEFGMNGVLSFAGMSGDGENLYVLVEASDCFGQPSRIVNLRREATGGGLVDGGATALEASFHPRTIYVSSDDRLVHVSDGTLLRTYRRDRGTGSLTREDEIALPREPDVPPFFFLGLVGAADASRLYAKSLGVVAELGRRSLATGELVVEQLHAVGTAGIAGGGSTSAHPVMSPDGRHLYLASNFGLAVLSTDLRLGVFDVAGRVNLLDPSAAPGARRVATSGRYALILTPESLDAVDLNWNGVPGSASGDETFFDRVAQLVDLSATPPQVTNLEVAGAEIALSDDLAAVLVPEAQQPVLAGGPDLNCDGDDTDLVLHVHAVGAAPPARNVGVTGDAIGVVGRRAVVISREADEGRGLPGVCPQPPGRDLNEDGDSLDRVIRIYNDAPEPPEPPLLELKLAAEEFVLGETLVAFRVSEAAQAGVDGCRAVPDGGCDLNGDEDGVDYVMHLYDLENGGVTNTELAASLCNFPGCGPFLEPYRIHERVNAASNRIRTLAFITREGDQGASSPGGSVGEGCLLPAPAPGICDLNGDGDGSDLVVQVFSMNSERSQVFETSEGPPGEPGVAPFPESVHGETVVQVLLPESAAGVDVNEDGQIDETPLVFITGDSDEDGTLDVATLGGDTCVEAANPEQVDADRDRLGDLVCDPDATTQLPGAGPPCDLDRDGAVTGSDLAILELDIPSEARDSDPRDPDGDGLITELDVAFCEELCETAGCPAASRIDIRPGEEPNVVNLLSRGLIPVAILGSARFDVSAIDRTTLRFGPAGATPVHKKLGHLEDVNGDGATDLVSHYPTQQTGLGPADAEACVSGATASGVAFTGCDEILVLHACGLGFELVLLLPPLAWLRARRRPLRG